MLHKPLQGPAAMSPLTRRIILLGVLLTPLGLCAGPLHQAALLPAPAALLLYAGCGVLAALAMLRGLAAARQAPEVLWVLLSLVPLAIVVPLGWMIAQGVMSPFAHDISTDPLDPPSLAATAELRSDNDRSPDWSPPPQGTPMPEPLTTAKPPAAVFAELSTLIAAREWTIVVTEAPTRLVATDRSWFFGFPDDIAIRLSPLEDGGTRVDVRSQSRVGASDLGVNAQRITALLIDLDALLKAQSP